MHELRLNERKHCTLLFLVAVLLLFNLNKCFKRQLNITVNCKFRLFKIFDMGNNQELIQVLRDLINVTKNYKVGINKDRLYKVENKTFKRAERILNSLNLQNVSHCACSVDETTGWTQVKCCNICGKPLKDQNWHCG